MCVTGIHRKTNIFFLTKKVNNFFWSAIFRWKGKVQNIIKSWRDMENKQTLYFCFCPGIFLVSYNVCHCSSSSWYSSPPNNNYLLIVHLLTPVSLHPTPRASKLQSAGHLRIFSIKFLTFTCYPMIELQSSCFNFHLLQNNQIWRAACNRIKRF